MRRQDGSIDFPNKLWNDYKDGFGQLGEEFWLGQLTCLLIVCFITHMYNCLIIYDSKYSFLSEQRHQQLIPFL